jgi:hypothetical protein
VDSAEQTHPSDEKPFTPEMGQAEKSIVGDASGLRAGMAAAIYVLFMLAVYWPVFLGKRFFWEDFFIQEYPIRDFCFYMMRFVHELPFWNPYSWAWSPLLADPQCGFWYPTNLLQIAITWLGMPHAVHLPVLVPETMTLLHLPLAALGVFVLLKKELRVSGIAALLAGLCWGFGVRMVAEQNHSMQILQLALLPWETLLLLRTWNSWRYAIGLGILFGISFFAGQPQTFFFIAIFLLVFTAAESLLRWRSGMRLSRVAVPVLHFATAMMIAAGVASIQLLPTMELVGLSARAHLDFDQAGSAGIHLGHFINFFVPKYYGENPGYNVPVSPTVHNHTWYWYWESEYYWGMLAEIVAVFAIITYWKQRGENNPASRYLSFFVWFSLFAIAFGMGRNLYVEWPFWRFLPFFDHLRAPNRMIWMAWFSGTLLTGIGLDALVTNPHAVQASKRYLYWAGAAFAIFNVLAIAGVFDYLFKPHTLRAGLWPFLAPSLITSVTVMIFLIVLTRKKLPTRVIALCIAILIFGDLFYNDVTWHRNTLNRETVVAQDSASAPITLFRSHHSTDHAKLLILPSYAALKMRANLGMFIHIPIEYADDSDDLGELNPVRLAQVPPLINDSIRRMEIMGVSTIVTQDSIESEYSQPLPFLKLYHNWRVTSGSNDSELLNDTNFDFTKEVSVSEAPVVSNETQNLHDTAILSAYSENHLRIAVTASHPSVLLVNDLYYPAWRATVDGKATKLLRAFTSLRAVPISAGIHSIEMSYDDPGFDLGWKITLGTFLVSILTLCIGRKKAPKA